MRLSMLVAATALSAVLVAACGARGRPQERALAVTSLRLTSSVPREVTASCVQAARMTRLRVRCPPLVPAGGVVDDHDLYGPQLTDRSSYSISINNGQNPGRIHWEIGAIRGPGRALWIFDRREWDTPSPKHAPELIGERRYRGRVVTLYRFPDSDGQLEGHDVALATKHDITYFVSIHGHGHDAADVAMLLAILAHTT